MRSWRGDLLTSTVSCFPNREDGFMRFIAPTTMPPRGNTTEKMFYINFVSTTGKARYRDIGAENMSFEFKKAPFGFRAKRDTPCKGTHQVKDSQSAVSHQEASLPLPLPGTGTRPTTPQAPPAVVSGKLSMQ